MTKKLFTLFVSVLFIFVGAFSLTGCGSNGIDEGSLDEKTFPVVYIQTENGVEIVSKEEYVGCLVTISNTAEEYKIENESARIKGRGNSTWSFPKKPYKLKFDSKINLFGNGKEKTWTLIANYCDKSLTRNLMAYEVARAIGLENTSSAVPVNLVMNGDYCGVYLLCEQVEIGKTRVNIESDLKDIDTGYLVEMDGRAPEEGVEDVDYFVIDDINYAVKDPETDDENFTSQHLDFIKNYFTEAFNALSSDYENVKNYIDVESFAKCYIVHEMFNCIDVGYSSFYMYKVKQGKLYAGPIWDFDISSGNCDYGENGTDVLYAKEKNVWYNKLLEYEEFNNLVGQILEENKEIINSTIQAVVDYQIEYKENNSANFDVWGIMGIYVWPNTEEIVKIKTFEGQVYYLHNWVNKKFGYMQEIYIKESV